MKLSSATFKANQDIVDQRSGRNKPNFCKLVDLFRSLWYCQQFFCLRHTWIYLNILDLRHTWTDIMTHVSESLNSMPEGKVVYLPGEKVVYQEKKWSARRKSSQPGGGLRLTQDLCPSVQAWTQVCNQQLDKTRIWSKNAIVQIWT